MNNVTKWYSNEIYRWIDEDEFKDQTRQLSETCTKEVLEQLLSAYENISLQAINYYPAGSYEEEGKVRLDNIDSFYEIRMEQKVAKNHISQFRVYLPVRWNSRFMGMAGAGTNNEVEWVTSGRFNVITWPIGLKNGYACAVSDNDTGTRLDCSWGFDEDGNLEWDHIEAWAFNTLHEMTVCAKDIITACYGSAPIASYIHGTSGGARQIMTEAALFPGDYDGMWADAPSIDHINLVFTCLWAPLVEANEKYIVALGKYRKAREIALNDPALREIPYNSKERHWSTFIYNLLGVETEDGPISRRDLQVMVKTWDGPVLTDGRKIAYGYGPTIRQWPEGNSNQMYGYLRRRENDLMGLMPIAEQFIRWFVGDPSFDVRSCTYEQLTEIYDNCHKKFDRYSFNECDFNALAQAGGKLMITQGTGDSVVPYQQMMDYYMEAFYHFPSEKIMNECVRLFMPEQAGHSILDWTGPSVSIADGMRALTAWAEKKLAPDSLPTMLYDFVEESVLERSEVKVYNQWQEKQKLKKYNL